MSNSAESDPLEETLAPYRRKAIQQADTTIPTPPEPPEVDPLEKVMQDTAFDPLELVLNPTPDSISRRLSAFQGQRELAAQTPTTPPTFAQRHPIIQSLVVDAARQAYTAVKWSLIGNPFSPDGPARLELYLAKKTPEEVAAEQKDFLWGSALLLSFGAGEITQAARIAPRVSGLLGGGKVAGLIGKWADFTVQEGLGGAIFGSIRPREEDETRLNAILGDAARFAAIGVGMRGTLEFIPGAYKRYILAMPRAKRIAALQRATRSLDEVDASLAHGNTSLDQLPAEHRAAIEGPILEEAISSVDRDFPKFVSKIVSDHLSAEPRPTLDDDFTAALQEVREARAATRARRAETARARRAAKKAKPPEEPPPEEPPPGGPPVEPPPPAPPAGAAPAAASAEESVDLIAPPSKTAPQGFSARVSPNAVAGEGPWKLAEFEGPRPEPGDAGAYQHFPTKEAALDAAAELGYRPMPAGEFITGPVVRGHSGKLYVNGETHGAVMESARAVGVPKGEFQGIGANHPNRGFRTNLRDFIDREAAGKMTGFPGRLFSEDMHALKATPLESTIAADTQIKDVARQIVEAIDDPEVKDIAEVALMDAATDRAVAEISPLSLASSEVKDAAATIGAATTRAMRHGTEVQNAVSIIHEGLRPGSSVSLSGGRDFEGYPIVLSFAGRGEVTPYGSPFGPTMHTGAATTGARQARITAVHMDVGDFTSREDAIEAYNQIRTALDETGRKDIPIEAIRFNLDTEKYTFGGKVDFSAVQPYGETLTRMRENELWDESGRVLDSLDAAERFGNTAAAEKYFHRANLIADEMEKRGLVGDAVVDRTVSDALEKFGESGQAEEEITQHLTHPTPGELAEEAKLTPHEQIHTEIKEPPKEPPKCL